MRNEPEPYAVRRRTTGATARRAGQARRAGTAAIELVLLLPLLITIISGTVDLGRIIQADMTFSNAVRVGAEYGAAHRWSSGTLPAWKTKIQDAVLMEASNLRGFDPQKLVVTVTPVVLSDEETVVTVTATYALSLKLFWVGSGFSVTLNHSVAMRNFR